MVIEKNIKQQILENADLQREFRIPASEAEFLSVAYEIPFKIEYHNSEIVSMGLASFVHEVLMANIAGLLNRLFFDDDSINVVGSSLGVHKQKFEGGYYSPDVTIVKGKPDFVKKSTAIISNPFVVFEVLSPSTKSFDLSEKLEEYKLIDSIEQIVFIYQDRMKVTSYRKSYEPTGWFVQDFFKGNENLTVLDKDIPLANIYNKVSL